MSTGRWQDESEEEYQRRRNREALEAKIQNQRNIIRKYKEIVRSLQVFGIRALSVLKYLARGFALVGCWFFIGHRETYYLAGFICLVALIQLGIDKINQVVEKDRELSELDPT